MDILGELQREKDKRQNTVSQDILGELQKEKDGAAAPAAPAPKSNGYAPMADLNRTTNGSGVTPASALLRQTTQEIAATLPEIRPVQTTRTHWDGTTRQRNDRGTMLREAIGKKYDTEGSIESGVERALALSSGAGAAGINALSAVDSTLSADRKRVETAQNNLAAYTANRDQAKTAAERDRWQKLADAAQRQIDAYSGAAEAKRQNAGEAAASLESLRDKLIQAASEGDYNARAGRALETVEKYGDKRYTDDLKGLIGSNYVAGRLSQNSSYAWNEYLDNPTPENRRIAELYDLAIENSGENNAAALEADGFLQQMAKSAAGYAPQFLDQTAARLKGGAVGLLAGQAGAGQAAGSALDMYAVTRGAAFRGLLDAGVPEEQAKAMAKDEAFISSLIEYADALTEYAWFGGKNIINLLLHGGADLATTQAGKSAGRAALNKLLAYAGNIGQEYAEEYTQEGVSIANENRLSSGTTGSGKTGLTRDALETIIMDGLLGRNQENRRRMQEAGNEGARIASMFGALEAGGGYVGERALNAGMDTTQRRENITDAVEQSQRDAAETEARTEDARAGDSTPDANRGAEAQILAVAEALTDRERQNSAAEQTADAPEDNPTPVPALNAVRENTEGIRNPADLNTEGIDDERTVYLRESGERVDGPDPAGEVRAVEEGAGRDPGGETQGRPRDGEAARLTLGKTVTTASFGIGQGSNTDRVRLIDSGETAAMRSARTLARSRGLRAVFFAGDDLTINGQKARGYVSGDRVFVRVDDAEFTSDQIMRHEAGHDRIAKGEINLANVRGRVVERIGEENVQTVAGLYAEAYAESGMSEDEIWEEIVCDSLGDMNVFSGIRMLDQPVGEFLNTLRSTAEQEAEVERGPPTNATQSAGNSAEGKASIETTADGKKYVRADRQVIFGNDPDSWSEQLEDYINGKIRRGQDVRLFTEDGDVLLLTKDSAGKISSPYREGRTIPVDEYERKLNAGAHIDELAQISKRGRNRVDKDGRHGDFAEDGWNYRTAYFEDFDRSYYRVHISVAQGRDGNVVYNIGKMTKEEATPQRKTRKAGSKTLSREASANMVAETTVESKSQNEKNTSSSEESVVYNVGNIKERRLPTAQNASSGSSVGQDGAHVGKSSDFGSVPAAQAAPKRHGISSDTDSIDNSAGKSKSQNEENASRRFDNLEALREENDDLRERVEELRDAQRRAKKQTARAEYWQGQTRRTTAPSVRESDINRVAKEIIKGYDSSVKASDISAALTDAGNYLLRGEEEGGGLTYDGLKERVAPIAREIIQNASVLVNGEDMDTYREVRAFLRRKMRLSPRDADNITDFADWKKRYRGRISISTTDVDAIPVDVAYAELNERFPWLFPELPTPVDQVFQMADALDSIAPIYENPYSYRMAEAVEYCTNDIIDTLISDQVRQMPPTFADRQAAKLEQAKAEGRQRVAEVREQKNARIEEIKKQGQERTAEAVRREREQKNARIEAIKKRGRERAAEAVNRERVKREEKIRDLKEHYREAQYAKQWKKAESNARSKLQRIVKRLQNKKLPAVSRALLNQYIGDIDAVSKSLTGKSVEKFSELEDWYLDQKENNPDFIADPGVEKMLRRLHARHINDMTTQEVVELTTALLNIENEIKTQRKLIDSADRRDTYAQGVQSIQDIENSRGNAGGAVDTFLTTELLTPTREMRRLTGYVDDDPLYILTRELEAGQRKMFDYQRRAGERFKRWVNDRKFIRRIAGKSAEEITIRGISADGPTEATITPAMRMSLYLHSKNSQNLRHIAGGGITVPDMALYKQGKLSEAYARGRTIKLEPSQVRAIVSNMTAEERAFADAASLYFNGMSRDAINETSEKLKGYSLADVENYFPINTDTSFNKKEFDAIKFDGTIEGYGFLKDRINASNPIMLRDMNAVLTQSIDQHARYYGLAIPVRNFNKVYGVTKSSFNEDGTRSGFEGSVQKALKQKWGQNAAGYVEKMMADLQNPPKAQQSWGRALSAVRSNYAGAVLELNASVAIKQSASYPTAAAVVGWRPLMKALADPHKVNLDLVARYTPLLWYRSQGYSSQELGDMAKSGKTLPKALNWIQGMDVATTTKLWRAAEYYVRENRQDLERASDAYYRSVAEVYNRIIEETQPNYTTMQRPQLLRSDNELVRTLNMFKTQPFQNFNILYDALGNAEAKRIAWENLGTEESERAYSEAKKSAGRAISSQIVSAFVFAAMQFAWDAFLGRTDKYKDDDDEMKLTSWLKGMGFNMASSGFGMLPFGTEALELGEALTDKLLKALGKEPFFNQKWYGVDVSVTESVNDTVEDAMGAVVGTVSLIQKGISSDDKLSGADWESYARSLYDAVDDLSKLAGLPLDNIRKLFTGLARNVLIGTEGKYDGGYDALRLTSDPAKHSGDYYNLLFDAYSHDADAYQRVYQKMLSSGRFTDDKIKGAMENRMKKAQGVESVTDLDERWMTPEQQEHYDKTLSRIEDTKIWKRAGEREGLQDKTMQRIYELASESSAGREMQEKIDGGSRYGLDEVDYLLYRAALDAADKPTEKGKYGSYTNEEVKAAISAVPGLTDAERNYLWEAQGKSEKNRPAW